MYPNFDQLLLKARLKDALAEAWAWEERKMDPQEGKALRLSRNGWVQLTAEEARQPTIKRWNQGEVLEMLEFVFENGYIKRGKTIYKQAKGFGMGLACAVQMANLGCYPPERDFAEKKQPEDVEFNFRFVDDTLSLTGCFPTQEDYGMAYISKKPEDGALDFVGVRLKWEEDKKGPVLRTGVHFRDGLYPIKIRRYPADGSMVSDSQRLGVIIGQFIRAQRLCSVLSTFKAAVQQVVLSAMQRGYKRRELDRLWGKFLMQWWKAEEVRRGELRAWFRRMSAVVAKKVRLELGQAIKEQARKERDCWFGAKCRFKDKHCPFKHPGLQVAEVKLMSTDWPFPRSTQDGWGRPQERMPKSMGTLWKAVAKGSCLLHSILCDNRLWPVLELRRKLHHFGQQNKTSKVALTDLSIEEMVDQAGAGYWDKMLRYDHWCGEVELVLAALVLKKQLRVFIEDPKNTAFWLEIAQYGNEGEVVRLLWTKVHYDRIIPKERWILEQGLREEEVWLMATHRAQGSGMETRLDLGGKWATQKRQNEILNQIRAKHVEEFWERQCQRRGWQVAGLRAKAVLPAADDPPTQETVDLLDSLWESLDPQTLEVRRILGCKQPWEVLEVEAQAGARECAMAYRMKAVQVHPDKCAHPDASRALQALADANEWALDKEAWEVRRLQRETQLACDAKEIMREWLRSGAAFGPVWWEAFFGALCIMGEEWLAFDNALQGFEWEALLQWELEDRLLVSASQSQSLHQKRRAKLYCICRKPHNKSEYWIQCVGCSDWFHPRCQGTTQAECEARRRRKEPWYCLTCQADSTEGMDTVESGADAEGCNANN